MKTRHPLPPSPAKLKNTFSPHPWQKYPNPTLLLLCISISHCSRFYAAVTSFFHSGHFIEKFCPFHRPETRQPLRGTSLSFFTTFTKWLINNFTKWARHPFEEHLKVQVCNRSPRLCQQVCRSRLRVLGLRPVSLQWPTGSEDHATHKRREWVRSTCGQLGRRTAARHPVVTTFFCLKALGFLPSWLGSSQFGPSPPQCLNPDENFKKLQPARQARGKGRDLRYHQHLRVQIEGRVGWEIIPRGGKPRKGVDRVLLPGRHDGLKAEAIFLEQGKQPVL